MAGVSPAIQTWSINTSIMQLRFMMNRMTITDDHIRRYVVSPDEGRRMEEERNRRQRSHEAAAATSSSTKAQQQASQQQTTATEDPPVLENVVHVTPANCPTVEVCFFRENLILLLYWCSVYTCMQVGKIT